MMTLPLHIKWIGNPFGRCAPGHRCRTPVYPLTNRLSVPVCYTKKISQKATFSKLFQRKREGDLGKQLKQIQFLYIWLRPQRGALDNLANA
jgi:hypothetical protein